MNTLIMDLFLIQHAATRHELIQWSHLDYYVVFINCLDSYSDGTHSLHWCASDVMRNFSKPVLMKKQTPLHLEWPEGEFIFIFEETSPLCA